MEAGRRGDATEMKNPDDVRLDCAAIAFWILHFAALRSE